MAKQIKELEELNAKISCNCNGDCGSGCQCDGNCGEGCRCNCHSKKQEE